MIKRFFTAFAVAILMLTGAMASAQPASGRSGYDNGVFNIGPNREGKVNYHGVCRYVTNMWDNWVAIPVRTDDEWSVGGTSFLAERRDNLRVNRCDCTTNCGQCADLSQPGCMDDPRNTVITFLGDGSASMGPWEDEVPQGVNLFVQQIKRAQNRAANQGISLSIRMNVIWFEDDGNETWWRFQNIAPDTTYPLDWFQTRGSTRLYCGIRDAILNEVDPQLSGRPGWRSVFVILSDGMDTDGGCTASSVKTMIDNREARAAPQNWQVMYLGALNGGNNTVATMEGIANSLGVGDGKFIVFNTNTANYQAVLGAAAVNAVAFATGGRGTVAWDEQQKDAMSTQMAPSLVQ